MTIRLRTLLGDHACTAALKRGAVKSDLVSLDFIDYTPTNKGFKPMVREQAFDVKMRLEVIGKRIQRLVDLAKVAPIRCCDSEPTEIGASETIRREQAVQIGALHKAIG